MSSEDLMGNRNLGRHQENTEQAAALDTFMLYLPGAVWR